MYPKKREISFDTSLHKVNLNENTQKLKTSIDKQEKDLHLEKTSIITKLKFDVDEMDMVDTEKRHDDEIAHNIAVLRDILNSKYVSHFFAY